MIRNAMNRIPVLVCLGIMVAVSGYVLAQGARYLLIDDDEDGEEIVVRDVACFMEWIREVDNSSGRAWKDALQFCKNLEYATKTDWRLPNVTELASLIDEKQPSDKAPINHYYFKEFDDSRPYWTSTTCPLVGSDGMAYVVVFNPISDSPFDRGGIDLRNKNNPVCNVICVRDSN